MHDAYEIIKKNISAKHSVEKMKIENFIRDGETICVVYVAFRVRSTRDIDEA